ncbi:MAG TPA: response regulator transcription factor [Tepidisphaeraceae bacterium]|nr:response regulator transcription factor [Tepidisphaeraceae bacterium]
MTPENQPHTLKVLLAEGRKLLREGLCALLERHEDIRVVGEVDDSRAAAKLIPALAVDVVVLNVIPPQYGRADVVRAITKSFPDVRVVVLTLDPTPQLLRELLNVGAHGCLTKESSATELVDAIRTVMTGKSYLSPRLVDVMVNGYARPTSAPPVRPLAPREREILQRIAAGESTKEIARALRVGTKTVETHRRRLMQKLNKHSVAELTKYAVLEGLTPLEPASQPIV